LNTISFLLALHNHQPVGNFDDVVEGAYQKAYLPFLEVLERHPSIRIGLHNSGCLIDWLEAHRPEYFDRLGVLVERGQVEPITGGYYEPVLPSIPEEDRQGQVEKLSRWIENRFGRRPRGLWLTERVWEPGLIGPLARAGVEYTMVDDSHFLAAGFDPDRLWGSFMTEDQAVPLRVFPISKELRYLIPFRPPEETVELLRRLAGEEPGRVALLGDDGEKFGVWPGTHDLVYRNGWLDRFFTLLEENREWLHLRFPGEAAAAPPVGKAYLPTASYMEMMEWALPAEIQNRYEGFLHRVEESSPSDARFVRGGFWRNFFARYDESDHINKRMLMLRGRTEAAPISEEKRAEARELLRAAQCNCAYWHGVFGGLYLPHLRDALYQRLLRAEALLDTAERGTGPWTVVERRDFDCDGEAEVFLANPDLTLVVSPREGGALQEIGVKPAAVAVTNGLTRRPEAYHGKVAQAATGDAGADGSTSIHDMVRAKEPGLGRYLKYDAYRRSCLVDHFLREDTTLETFRDGSYGEQGNFVGEPYEGIAAETGEGAVLSLRREGAVWRGGAPGRIALEKRLRLNRRGAGFGIEYLIENLGRESLSLWFAGEWNFGLLAGHSSDHRYRIAGVPDAEAAFDSCGEVEGITEVVLADRHRRFRTGLRFPDPTDLWRLPVETVSLSEDGFERIYQSSCLLVHRRLALPAGSRTSFGMTFFFETE